MVSMVTLLNYVLGDTIARFVSQVVFIGMSDGVERVWGGEESEAAG